jgi:hypothetical protein
LSRKAQFVDGSLQVAEESEFLGGGRTAFEENFEVRQGLLTAGGGGVEEGYSGVGGEVCGLVSEDEPKILDGLGEVADVNGNVGESGGSTKSIFGVIRWNFSVVLGGRLQFIAASGGFAGDQHGLREQWRVGADENRLAFGLRIATLRSSVRAFDRIS